MSACKNCFLLRVNADAICEKCDKETEQLRKAGEDMEYPFYHIEPFSKGDKVLVKNKETSFESGWREVWVDDMDKYIGKTGKIESISLNRLSASVYFESTNESWEFPLWTLELQETTKDRAEGLEEENEHLRRDLRLAEEQIRKLVKPENRECYSNQEDDRRIRIKDLEDENYMLARDLRLAEARIKELEGPPPTTEPGYASLSKVLQEALDQAQSGKGHKRHAAGEPFESQEICANTRAVGLGFPLGQARKKAREAKGIFEKHGADAAVPDLLGAINYLAAAIIVMREK